MANKRADKAQDKRQFLEWMITSLQEKLQEETDCSSQSAGEVSRQNGLGPSVNNYDGSENNHGVLPTASLGGQGHQLEPRIPTRQEEGDGSESVESEPAEHSGEEEGALQNPGDGEPPKKKQKLTDGSDPEISGTDDYFIHLITSCSTAKSMEFDPSELVKKKEGTFSAPEQIASYLDKRMKRCLTKDEREALIKDHPRPDSASCKVPAVDKYVKEFLGKKFPKEEDSELAKIQAAALLPICPLTSAWNSLLQCGADEDPDMPVRASEVITMIQCTLCLIGNTSEFISQTRRAKILEKIDTSWSKYAQEDFSEAKETLFGESFQVTLSDKVEKEAALAKAVAASKRSKEVRERDTQSNRRKDNHGRNQFFRRSPAAGYGGKQGKSFQPYSSERNKENRHQQGRYLPTAQRNTHSLFHEPSLPRQNQQANQFKK